MASKKPENEESSELTSAAMSLSRETKKYLKNLAEEVAKPVEYLDTGNIGLNLALSDGKGLPVGSSTLLWADPGCGKTTVVVDACKRLIASHKAAGKPFKVLFIDVEDSTGLIMAMGMKKYIDSHDFIHVRNSFTWRMIETFYEAVLQGVEPYNDVKLIVIDSVNNVLSDRDLKNSVADGDLGNRSRERAKFYSKYLPRCKQSGISSFFISQVRVKQNVNSPYEDTRKAAVSKADMHNVDIILKCGKKSDSKSKVTKTLFGDNKKIDTYIFTMDSSATDCKNRYFSGAACEIMVSLGKGVKNCYVIRKILEIHNLLKLNGAYYKFEETLGKSLGVGDKSLLQKEVNLILEEHMGEIVELLRSLDKLKLILSEENAEESEEELEEVEV